MDRVVRRFSSFEEAEAAERTYYRSLTPNERIAILLELIASVTEALPEAEQRLERVCRVTRIGIR
jgi:hypothetical protein